MNISEALAVATLLRRLYDLGEQPTADDTRTSAGAWLTTLTILDDAITCL